MRHFQLRVTHFFISKPSARLLTDKGVDVAAFFGGCDFVEVYEYAALFHIAKLVVDGGAEHAHGGRETHVSADERRNVDVLAADVAVEEQVVFLEIISFEKSGKLFNVTADVEGCDGSNQLVVVREIEVQEAQ